MTINHVPVAHWIERLPSKQSREANSVNSVNNLNLLNSLIEDRKATKGLTAGGERWLKETLSKFLSWLPVSPNQATRAHIVRFLGQYEAMPWRKHSMYRALRAFWRWVSTTYDIPNPMMDHRGNPVIDAPKTPSKVLYTMPPDKVQILLKATSCVRDEAIVSLLADSGARLSEMANINVDDLDLERKRIKVLGKGNNEGYLVFGAKTQSLVANYIWQAKPTGNLFGLNSEGVKTMLQRLAKRTGIKCNAHSFRRGFATALRHAGVGELDIQQLGRWSSLEMVRRYTKAYTFDDAAARYKPIVT